MRIVLTIDGGFAYVPELARPVVLDGDSLTGEDAAQLRRLCDAALAATRERVGARRVPMPDARSYRIVIESDQGRREIATADPVAPPVAALIAFVRVRASKE